MISAKARTVRSIAEFQEVLDIGAEDPGAEQALEGQDVVEEEVPHLGKIKPVSTFIVLICTANISNRKFKLKKYRPTFDKCALVLSI